jgi:hypothetical protein
MKQFRFLSLILLLVFSYASSQTEAQRRQITKNYDIEKLQQMSKAFSERYKLEKQKALNFAKKNNIEITKTYPDGSYAELQRIAEDGTLIYYRTNNVDAAASTRTNYLNSGGGLGLSLDGQNMTAYVWDGGHVRTTHQEFSDGSGGSRVSLGDVAVEGLDVIDHATHVTGTICAEGIAPAAKGMAPEATAVSYKWNDDVAEALIEASNGMLVSNHSYSLDPTDLDDYFFGGYTYYAYEWDLALYNTPFYLMVVSAGNIGNNNDLNGTPLTSGFDKLTGKGVTKNNLVVANAQDAIINPDGSLNSVLINDSSSQGPTDDFRIKPDITGNGTGLISPVATADNTYASASGTSMSAPNVAGSLLLLQQHHNNLFGTFMRAATLKGLALHTADDAGITGPDAVFGWGLLNAKRAAETLTAKGSSTIVEEIVLNQGETYTINVEADQDVTNDLLASISWTDPAGDWNTNLNDPTPVLVNDLDIKITQNTDTYYPWRLTGVDTNANNAENLVDNFERVDISGASGTYTINITHKGTLSDGPQQFSLIVTGLQNANSFCSAPQNIEVTDIATTTAEVSWNPSVSSPTSGYNIYYNTTGTLPSASTTPSDSVLAGNTNYSISGLTAGTEYYLFVRADCGSGNTSEWSEVTTFTTLCNSVTFPYSENFDGSSSVPTCWTQSRILQSELITSNCGINNTNYLRIYGGFHSLESPPVDVSGQTNIEINFDIRNGCFEPAEANENLEVYYWNGTDWILLDTLDPANLSQFWVHKSYQLSTGLNTAFRLQFLRKGGSLDYDDISIDNLEIKAPTPAPANDNACNAIALTLNQASTGDAYTIKAATAQVNEPDANLNNGVDGSVWFTFQAPSSGDVRITTDLVGAKSDDLELAVYSATDCIDFTTFSQIGFDQDDGRDVNIQRMPVLDLIGLNSGDTYYIQVDRLPNSSSSTFGIEVLDLYYSYDSVNGYSPINPNGKDLTAYEGDLIGGTLEVLNGTATITSATALNEVIVNPAGILDLEANLTSDLIFKSDANSSGQLANASGNSITGSATVERHMTANRAYRFVASPVTTTGTIRENWQQNGLNDGDNGFENNVGTHITGNAGSANGFDNSGTNNPSMFTFNNSTGAYEEVTNTNANTLQVGQAYALFVRGDRTIDLTNNSAEPNVTRLKANGALHIGDYPGSPEQINTSADGYSLIANPYQAIVDFNAITFAGDVNANSFYMFNPTSTVDNPFGTFESIDATTEPANAMIQPGQSFFVQNLSTVTTNPTVQFTEAAKKTDGNLTTVFSDPSIALANLHLYNASNESVDVIKFRFQHEANNGIDEYDSRKFSNQVLNFASVSNNELLAIDRRDIPDTNDIIPLFIENYQGNQYEFRVNIENWDNNIDMYVVDSYLNTSTLIHNNQPYAFVVDATVPESMASDRFSLSFDNSTLNTQDQVFDATFRLYPNPADNGVFNIQFSTFNNDNINLKLYNILGQNVFTQNVMMDGSGKASVDVSQLSSGVYLVEIIQNEIKLIRKLVID